MQQITAITEPIYRLKYYGDLPDYYISSAQLEELRWNKGDRPSRFAPDKMLGGDIYNNGGKRLSTRVGRVWYEVYINCSPDYRNLHRIVWSNNGLIFVAYDHYHTFYEII